MMTWTLNKKSTTYPKKTVRNSLTMAAIGSPCPFPLHAKEKFFWRVTEKVETIRLHMIRSEIEDMYQLAAPGCHTKTGR